MGIVVHLSATRTKPDGTAGEFKVCGGSFSITYAKENAHQAISDADLIGYKVGSNIIALNTITEGEGDDRVTKRIESDYELLAKAIGGYNGGATVLTGYSWPDWLKRTPPSTTGTSGNSIGVICNSCAYALGVKNVNYGLPYRQYVWVGAREPDQIPDPDFAGEGDAPMIDNPNAGQPAWCFAYGEEEWMNPYTIENRDGTTRNATFTDYKNRAKTNVAKREVSCS